MILMVIIHNLHYSVMMFLLKLIRDLLIQWKIEVGDGLGTEDLPFLIRTNQDLEDLKTMINAGNTFLGFYFPKG